MAVAILLISYYIFVIKCCLNWQNLDPLRRFSISRTPRNDEGSIISFSPMMEPFHHRGLDEFLINNIPSIQYKSATQGGTLAALGGGGGGGGGGSRSFRGCAVCLNKFEEKEMLRVLPRCNHTFHLDCIDVWLLNNASCPLCRSNISGRKTKYPLIAPSSSPQEELIISPNNMFSGSLSMISLNGDDDQDYLVTEESSSSWKLNNNNHNNNFSIMGDECIINVREKDEQFEVQQPIRRSFSMDSVADRGLILQVQEIIRRNHRQLYDNCNNNEVSISLNEECNHNNVGNGRIRRSSFFSFGHGRGSRSSSILPIECDR